MMLVLDTDHLTEYQKGTSAEAIRNRFPGRHLRVYPDGAMILHYETPDNVGLATAGLVPVER